MTIQQRIKERRLALGMTLASVAYQIGISESTLSRYETSGIQNMGIDKLKKLADVLKTTPSYLMGWDEPDVDYIMKLHGDDFIISYMKAPREVQESIQAYGQFMMEKWENENRETPKR